MGGVKKNRGARSAPLGILPPPRKLLATPLIVLTSRIEVNVVSIARTTVSIIQTSREKVNTYFHQGQRLIIVFTSMTRVNMYI